jgi:hypothetical protein
MIDKANREKRQLFALGARSISATDIMFLV